MSQVPEEADAESIKEYFETLTGAQVFDVQIVESTGDAIEICVRRGRYLKKLARLDARVKMLTKKNKHERHIVSAQVKADKIRMLVAAMDEKAAIRAELGAPLMAFVTFESQLSKEVCMKMFDVLWIGCKQPEHLRFKTESNPAGFPVRLQSAPPPSTLLWENQEYSRLNKFSRSLLVFFLLLSTLVVTASISYLADEFKAFSEIAELGDDGGDKCNGRYATFDAASVVVAAANEDQDCFCETIFLQKGGNDPLFMAGELCEFVVDEKLNSLTTEAGLSVAILFLNVVIYRVLVVTAEFEKFRSLEDREKSVLKRLFMVSFMNTALVILLVNTDLEALFGAKIDLTIEGNTIIQIGTFTDFAPGNVLLYFFLSLN